MGKKGGGLCSTRKGGRELPLIVSFETDPPPEIKTALKGLKFRWNAFRREWYGYGQKDQLEELLKASKATIETSTP